MKIEKNQKLRTIRYIEIQRFEIYPISLFSWGRTVLGNQRSSTYSVFKRCIEGERKNRT